MIKKRVELGGEIVEIVAQKIRGQLWYHVNGETRVYEPATRGRSRSNAKVASDRLQAPMPGKILRVNAKAGAQVQVGDILIVMEAMKMEYTLLSELNGLVAEVTCQTGDQVKLGQLLVRLSPEGE